MGTFLDRYYPYAAFIQDIQGAHKLFKEQLENNILEISKIVSLVDCPLVHKEHRYLFSFTTPTPLICGSTYTVGNAVPTWVYPLPTGVVEIGALDGSPTYTVVGTQIVFDTEPPAAIWGSDILFAEDWLWNTFGFLYYDDKNNCRSERARSILLLYYNLIYGGVTKDKLERFLKLIFDTEEVTLTPTSNTAISVIDNMVCTHQYTLSDPAYGKAIVGEAFYGSTPVTVDSFVNKMKGRVGYTAVVRNSDNLDINFEGILKVLPIWLSFSCLVETPVTETYNSYTERATFYRGHLGQEAYKGYTDGMYAVAVYGNTNIGKFSYGTTLDMPYINILRSPHELVT